jgi:phenylacetate-CoA ligase
MTARRSRPATDFVYSNYVLPLLEPESYRGVEGYRRYYESREQLTLEKNSEQQWQRVLQMLDHAYHSTAFYRRRFDEAGIALKQVQSPADLQKIPLLTRDDLRVHLREMTSDKFRTAELVMAATGGTTDTPVKVFRDATSLPRKSGVQMRFNDWAGFSPGDKVFYLWGAQSDYPVSPSWRWRLFDHTIMRRHWAPTSLLNAETFNRYRSDLNRVRPRVVYAYPTPLTLFCEHLLQSQEPYHRPETVICTAETLLQDQRATIEAALGCKVFEQYGARDFGMVAGECAQHNGLHVNPAAVFIEQPPLPGAESRGLWEMIVTDLLNEGMPLIRYKINDCSGLSREVCPCGIGYPLIGSIQGRVTDNFYLPDHSIVPGVALTNRVIKAASGIRKLQIIQERPEAFTIKFVPDDSFTAPSLTNLREKLIEFLGPGLEFEFQRVDDISRERSGKTRLCISKVKAVPDATGLAVRSGPFPPTPPVTPCAGLPPVDGF